MNFRCLDSALPRSKKRGDPFGVLQESASVFRRVTVNDFRNPQARGLAASPGSTDRGPVACGAPDQIRAAAQRHPQAGVFRPVGTDRGQVACVAPTTPTKEGRIHV